MAKHAPADVRRAQIIAAAVEVCGERGIEAARIDDIAARAGLSKGAVYHHFSSKQELFVAVMEAFVDEAMAMIDALRDAGAPAAETMRKVVEDSVAMVETNPKLVNGLIELYFQARREPALRQRLDRHYQALIAAGARVLQRGVESGELRDDIDADEVSRLIFIGGDGLLLMHLALDDTERAADSVRALAGLILRAISKRGESS